MVTLIAGTVGSGDNVFMDVDHEEFHGGMLKVQSAPQFQIGHSSSSDESGDDEVVVTKNDERVDKVYTVGCFDLFHRGHVNLLKNMRKLGKEVPLSVCVHVRTCVHACVRACVCTQSPINQNFIGKLQATGRLIPRPSHMHFQCYIENSVATWEGLGKRLGCGVCMIMG